MFKEQVGKKKNNREVRDVEKCAFSDILEIKEWFVTGVNDL